MNLQRIWERPNFGGVGIHMQWETLGRPWHNCERSSALWTTCKQKNEKPNAWALSFVFCMTMSRLWIYYCAMSRLINGLMSRKFTASFLSISASCWYPPVMRMSMNGEISLKLIEPSKLTSPTGQGHQYDYPVHVGRYATAAGRRRSTR